MFQPRAVQHIDVAAAVADDPRELQFERGGRDAFTAHTQQAGQQFLRHDQGFGGQTVQPQQEAAAQLLVDRVVAVADRRLRHLGDHGLGVAQQNFEHRATAVDLVLDRLRTQPVGLSRVLHHRLAGRGAAAHEDRNPDHAVVAHHRDLGRPAVQRQVQQRDYCRTRKIHIRRCSARIAEHLAHRQVHQFELGQPAFPFGIGQQRKQLVLARIGCAAWQRVHGDSSVVSWSPNGPAPRPRKVSAVNGSCCGRGPTAHCARRPTLCTNQTSGL